MIALVRFLLGFMLVLTSLLMIFLVLIQRGRGGGLAGAFGGMGGQSAFGTKAGDVFTKITVGVATFWILLCVLSINVLGRQQSLLSGTLGSAAPQAVGPSAGALPGAEAAPSGAQPAATGPTSEAAAPAQTPAGESPASAPAPAAPAASAPAASAPATDGPAAAEPAATK